MGDRIKLLKALTYGPGTGRANLLGVCHSPLEAPMKLYALSVALVTLSATLAAGCDGDSSDDRKTRNAALTVELGDAAEAWQGVELRYPVGSTAEDLGARRELSATGTYAVSPDSAVSPRLPASETMSRERRVDTSDAVQVGRFAELRLPVVVTLPPDSRRREQGPLGGVSAVNPDWAAQARGSNEPAGRLTAEVFMVGPRSTLQRLEVHTPGVHMSLKPTEVLWPRDAHERNHVAQGPMHKLIHPIPACGGSDTDDCRVSYELVIQFDSRLTEIPAAVVAEVQVQLVGAAPMEGVSIAFE
jgi:hypothetical protein